MGMSKEARSKAMGELLKLASQALRKQMAAKKNPPKPAGAEVAPTRDDELSDEDARLLAAEYEAQGSPKGD